MRSSLAIAVRNKEYKIKWLSIIRRNDSAKINEIKLK